MKTNWKDVENYLNMQFDTASYTLYAVANGYTTENGHPPEFGGVDKTDETAAQEICRLVSNELAVSGHVEHKPF